MENVSQFVISPLKIIETMKALSILSLFAGAILTMSCNSQSDKGSALVFEERVFNMQSASCQTDSTRCAEVKTTYPIAIEGNAEVIQIINDSIMFHLCQSISPFAESPEQVSLNLEEAAATFIGEYQYFISEEPEYEIGWALETNGQVLYQSPKYISIELSNYSFTGGAHPNSYTTYLNFDAKTGAKIDPVELVSDVKRLMQLAEARFKEAREMPADANLIEEGFFWDGAFVLPQNIAIVENGLQFYYNPYEVAAYVMGPTEFVVTYEEMGDIWKG